MIIDSDICTVILCVYLMYSPLVLQVLLFLITPTEELSRDERLAVNLGRLILWLDRLLRLHMCTFLFYYTILDHLSNLLGH